MHKLSMPSAALAACLLIASGSAAAHTFGAAGAGLAQGFAHPFLVADHLLAMLAVGIWSALQGGRSLWQLPLAFVAAMSLGGWLGLEGLGWGQVEPLIALSVVVLGLLVASRTAFSGAAGVALVALFALFHGYAHGAEIPEAAAPLAYAAGFLLATAALHGLGLALGLSSRRWHLLPRLGGAAIAATGVYLLAGL